LRFSTMDIAGTSKTKIRDRPRFPGPPEATLAPVAGKRGLSLILGLPFSLHDRF
jgi:hypothetical protein